MKKILGGGRSAEPVKILTTEPDPSSSYRTHIKEGSDSRKLSSDLYIGSAWVYTYTHAHMYAHTHAHVT